eukprot:Rmarinus@m.15679
MVDMRYEMLILTLWPQQILALKTKRADPVVYDLLYNLSTISYLVSRQVPPKVPNTLLYFALLIFLNLSLLVSKSRISCPRCLIHFFTFLFLYFLYFSLLVSNSRISYLVSCQVPRPRCLIVLACPCLFYAL